MSHWGFWEWLGYTTLWIAAVITGADTALKLAPELRSRPRMQRILQSPYWAFAPLILLTISAIAFFLFQTGTGSQWQISIPVLIVVLLAVILLLRQFRPAGSAGREAPWRLVPSTRYQYVNRNETNFHVEPPSISRPKDVIQWSVSIFPKQSISDVTVRLDYIYHTGGMNGYWTPEKSIFVKKLDFTIKAAKNIIIAESTTREGCRFWNWAFGDKGLISHSSPMHRCSLVFLIGNNEIDRFDFLIYSWKEEGDTDHKKVDLIFIGEDRFSFAGDWPAMPSG
jgi:hypothetical protein